MIQINELSLQYGDKHIFKDISTRINNQDRIGLVGVNGTGKSTLLKMLVGDIETDFSVITKSKQATLGYLPQEITAFPAGKSLYHEAETAFDSLISLHKKLETINNQLSNVDPKSSVFSDLLHQQGELQQLLDESDFFQIRTKTEKVLIGLGFSEEDLEKDCNDFSGGWQMRLMLAKHLLARPSFLFLDEPTNHLDIDSLTWLESFLASYKGSIVIISHDRAFLDNLTSITWELSLGNLTVYKGNYTTYLKEKDIRLEVQRAAYNNQQAKIQQTMRFVTRFRAKSTKAKQVQSRIKQLSKMERLELEEFEQKVNFRFPPSAPSGRLAIEAEQLSKSYDDNQVFNNISIEINRGDKVAIVGVNGAGKSTFVKLLSGIVKQDSGNLRFGHNVKISYFGQHQAQDLSPELTVLQTMEQIKTEHTTTSVRSLLGAFLFRGQEVDKLVAVLSGGEKSRLALAKMIATPANLLIMDEPTNHLDILSQEVLQVALSQYDGTIIVVSHNRFFLDSFVNKVVEIKDGKAVCYEGNLSEYITKLNQNIEQSNNDTIQQKAAPSPTTKANGKPKLSSKEARQANAREREERKKTLGPLKKEISTIENEIESFEDQKSSLEAILADPELYNDQEAFAEQSTLYKKTDERLTRCYHNWEKLQAKFEKAEKKFNSDM